FMYHEPQADIETVNVRLEAIGAVPKPEIARLSVDGFDPDHALKGARPVYFEECDGFTDAPVYDGDKLSPGISCPGPAIGEEVTTTTIVIPDWGCEVDVFGNLVLEKL
ncbi:MAG TPA: hypothetical protein QGI30_07155, partial [Anaerolineales bacterium]|nr:hypothetical protein [Anaerolineales bacterium]